MALTVRADGQTIHSNWVNDYHDLLTGAMTDQPVTLKTGLTVSAIGAAPAAPSAAATTGTTLGIGVYKHAVTFVAADGGETLAGAQSTVTTSSGNQAVALTLIPTGPSGTVKRNLYRTIVGGSQLKLVTSINDNTTTSYTDSTADGSLGVNAPLNPSFGGSLVLKDSSGTIKAQVFSNGAVWFDGGTITSDGSGDLTATAFWGKIKTIRNGTAQVNTIFTGTGTPSSPAVGDIWIKA